MTWLRFTPHPASSRGHLTGNLPPSLAATLPLAGRSFDQNKNPEFVNFEFFQGKQIKIQTRPEVWIAITIVIFKVPL